MTDEQYAEFGKSVFGIIHAVFDARKVEETDGTERDQAVDSYIAVWRNQKDQIETLRELLERAIKLLQRCRDLEMSGGRVGQSWVDEATAILREYDTSKENVDG